MSRDREAANSADCKSVGNESFAGSSPAPGTMPPRCIPRNFLISNLAAMLYMQRGDKLTYLELGTAFNETLDLIAQTVPGARCIGVDPKAATSPHPNVELYSMTSAEYFAAHAKDDAPFDLCYIDADHSYEAVKSDFACVWHHMSDQSLILLDDTWPESREGAEPGYSNDAYRMYFSLMNDHYESVTIPATPGLTIIRKASSHLRW